jgi:hypothetical protein
MASDLVTVAEAVKTALTATVTGSPWSGTISRDWVPVHPLEDLAALTVTVVARAQDRTQIARVGWRRANTVDVGVQGRAATTADVDALVGLTESLAAILEQTKVNGRSPDSVKVDPTPDEGHLHEKGLYTAIIRAVYPS